ncbi:MAG TPA: hypothetical protein VGG08_03895 [Solirubrobacteraceae bacterium]|jgi:hypothetical protein
MPVPSIRHHPLLLCGPFGRELPTEQAATALTRGLPSADVIALKSTSARGPDARRLLDDDHFDRRMLASRALILAFSRLESRHLAGSLLLEAATRARQSGIPSYAVCADDRLEDFDARLMDIQIILETRRDASGLARVGRKLASLI